MRIQTRQLHHRTLLSLVQDILLDPLKPVNPGFSADHLNRFFKDGIGESLEEFARRVRLERSALLILEGLEVGEVALRSGYESGEAFTKAFRKAYGTPPSQFKTSSKPWQLPGGIHYGDQEVPLAIHRATDFEASLCFREDLGLAGRLHVGDFSRIPAAWSALAAELGGSAQLPSFTWVSVFHSDGMRTERREEMRAHLAYLHSGVELLPGFEPLLVPGGAFVCSRVLQGRKEHREAWEFFNATWVPKRGPRPDVLPGYDVYESIPVPFEELRARIYLRLE
jgi:AraC family transcriptional regulator